MLPALKELPEFAHSSTVMSWPSICVTAQLPVFCSHSSRSSVFKARALRPMGRHHDRAVRTVATETLTVPPLLRVASSSASNDGGRSVRLESRD